jgi:hypothetical protein
MFKIVKTVEQIEVVKLHRLNKDQYDQLVKQIGIRLAPPNDGIQAGVMVGVQMVLEKLRDGFVVEQP